jgi:hypothetical protein
VTRERGSSKTRRPADGANSAVAGPSSLPQ